MAAMVTKQSGKEVEWRRRLARLAGSGQQVKQFCQAERVSTATFYRWHKLLGDAAAPSPGSGFIDAGPMQHCSTNIDKFVHQNSCRTKRSDWPDRSVQPLKIHSPHRLEVESLMG